MYKYYLLGPQTFHNQCLAWALKSANDGYIDNTYSQLFEPIESNWGLQGSKGMVSFRV